MWTTHANRAMLRQLESCVVTDFACVCQVRLKCQHRLQTTSGLSLARVHSDVYSPSSRLPVLLYITICATKSHNPGGRSCEGKPEASPSTSTGRLTRDFRGSCILACIVQQEHVSQPALLQPLGRDSPHRYPSRSAYSRITQALHACFHLRTTSARNSRHTPTSSSCCQHRVSCSAAPNLFWVCVTFREPLHCMQSVEQMRAGLAHLSGPGAPPGPSPYLYSSPFGGYIKQCLRLPQATCISPPHPHSYLRGQRQSWATVIR